jgi:glycerol-3-phosphate dehydrogenase
VDLRDSAGGDSALNAQRRTRELEQFANGDSVDVLVIGGGITGVGVALDAVTRGVRNWHTAAFGTSPPAMSV